MIGEYLREAAVLVAVFAILDKLVQGHVVTLWWSVSAISVDLSGLASSHIERRAWRHRDRTSGAHEKRPTHCSDGHSA
jgi:hypothetical protein